ncbi:hypothetical protein [Streptomyces showdoensis]|uniref:Membrane protein n=1 Tax=Streptomyces showdoensis TaxID=68268 RepID=A0A2P2GLK5_STREW|nr:hypothetical protein [Streptomyces showdoensis]KKZ72382.1 membrane protein [Streptomyces showdoensis]
MAEQQDGEREPQPIDEEAAWAAIVAGYGEEPADPPGSRPFRPVEDLALPAMPEDGGGAEKPDKFRKPAAEDADAAGAEGPGGSDSDEAGSGRPALGSSIVFAPGVSLGGGPRDYSVADPDEADEAPGGAKGSRDSDEGHFVPPEPPPLPEADATTKFAWLAVVGGPVLMLLAVLLQWDMTWWLTTVCVGGFLGGFATLVARMKHDDEDDDGFDDPGRGAVV